MSLRARNVGTNSASKPLVPNQYQQAAAAVHVDDLEGGAGGATTTTTSTVSSNNSRHSSNNSLNRMEIDSGSTISNGGSIPVVSVSNNSMGRVSHAFHGKSASFGILTNLTSGSTMELFQKSLGALAVVCILARLIFPLDVAILCIVYASCGFGAVICLWLSRVVLQSDDGTPEMRAVSDPIKEGAEGFLTVQYTAITKFAGPLALLIIVSYQFRPADDGANATGASSLGNAMLGIVAAVGFGFGAVCSAISGYTAMWVAARSNIRVTSAARRSYTEALVTCFRGGAFSAVLNLTLCITGVTSFYTLLYLVFCTGSNPSLTHSDLPMLMVGYGFGASFVALFMQLGGGIYTKAADVGADLVGKVEQSIPEDDPRNPAVIADLVGDMVGDCVGSSADVFESVAAEIIGAMILGSTLAKEAELDPTTTIQFLFFPLVVHAMDIIVSSVGIASVSSGGNSTNPMDALQKGYRIALLSSVGGFFLITRWLLHPAPFCFFLCGIVGMICAYIIVLSTQYYTDYEYAPVQSIAEASTTGHGTNIIVGISVGMKATFIPTITVAIAVLCAYHLGKSSLGSHNAGLFGTAVATMGMLSNAVYILAMNNYGPIADNAGGIAEMSQQPQHVRDATDKLDAAGNVTKAITKGYSIGSASMACFLLFGAFMDEFSQFSGLPFDSVNLATPEVLIGGLIGSMIIFYFTGLAISAVGRTAHEVVLEVRRQFREHPGIMTYEERPDNERCVSLVTTAALREMRFPGLVCVLTPIIIGIIFRFVGEWTDRPLLGAEVLAAYLMFGTTTGILMALFLDTTGGAWDNAKKYIELGNFGGKNSEAHKASVTGDTVGDPFKDTAGPSLHVVIKLLSTTILVAGPLFIANMGGSR
mmetsp:Transcript_8103/g.12053  ORF Transcript_8103/g.12053 Transcript_8103/m.12053 type:complete len:874 (-) Transcript_8103:192-2813(-)|eukprot:CAMPEP_0116025272 /NCGR_PEP_ID=MMETSP0321-20121206/12932_1 /TAXON_ID=163516 /ORGANISM="Leptocylindrus danicus var. danicus, Strain B650" /LENGTH=873 /DNA_ID=CAMNT_0003497399 /DNA_START=366 /DNA_END=2987 /DNA_ORIENTATION=+